MTEPGRAGEWEKADDDVLIPWATSSYSGEGQDCVEVRIRRHQVDLRDTKDREGGMFTMSYEAFAGLKASIKKKDGRE
ncbi:DUF397 domain-containing protein [Amycolatopsis japonica]